MFCFFFPNFKIKTPLTEKQADSILRLSFENHLKRVDHFFPGLKEVQRYAVAHLSYGRGIGGIKRARLIYKRDGEWVLNVYNLFNYRKVDREHPGYRANRKFELKLFNS